MDSDQYCRNLNFTQREEVWLGKIVKMKNIAFDFDFTLADSTESIVESLQSAFSLSNIRPEVNIRDNFAKIKGLKLREQLATLTPSGITSRDVEHVASLFMDLYRSIGVKKTIAYPGAGELFYFLSSHGFKIHIVSAKSLTNLKLTLEHLNLEPDVITGGVALQEKVDYLRFANCSSYVGDMEIDVKISSEAGCRSIIVNSQTIDTSKWKFQADIYFDSLIELFSWVKKPENLSIL